jgi:hypothetical protein
MNKLIVLLLAIVALCNLCNAQPQATWSAEIKIPTFDRTLFLKSYGDREIRDLASIVDTLDQNLINSFSDGLIFFSSQLIRDANYRFSVIGFDSTKIGYSTQSNLMVNLGKNANGSFFANHTPQYQEFQALFKEVPDAFFKQLPSNDLHTNKSMKQRKSTLLFLVKKHGKFTGGVFSFDASEFQNNVDGFPPTVYNRILLWLSLNCP